MKRLFLDIETSPNTVFSWRVGHKIDLSPTNIIEERKIICICWKFEGEKTTKTLVWTKDHGNAAMIRSFVPVLDSADEIVMHNGSRFDLPWIKTMAVLYGVPVNPFHKVVDTCTFARKHLYFNSNRLGYLGSFLGVGEKIKTDFDLWRGVVAGDAAALARMIRYCRQDVIVLEKVYKRLAICMPPKSHVGALAGAGKWTCPHCGGSNVHCTKTRNTAHGTVQYQMQCSSVGCGKYFSIGAKEFSSYSALRHGLHKGEK